MNRDILIISSYEIDRWGFNALSDASKRCRFHSAQPHYAISDLFQNSTPDLALIDLDYLPKDPLGCIMEMRTNYPSIATLLLTRYEHPQVFLKAANAGVLGAITKSDHPSVIWDKFEVAFRGESIWSRDELRRLAVCASALPAHKYHSVPLTLRERDVIERLASGYSNRRIAEDLKISYETVKEHVQHILRKLAVTDRTQAAVWAVRNKIV